MKRILYIETLCSSVAKKKEEKEKEERKIKYIHTQKRILSLQFRPQKKNLVPKLRNL